MNIAVNYIPPYASPLAIEQRRYAQTKPDAAGFIVCAENRNIARRAVEAFSRAYSHRVVKLEEVPALESAAFSAAESVPGVLYTRRTDSTDSSSPIAKQAIDDCIAEGNRRKLSNVGYQFTPIPAVLKILGPNEAFHPPRGHIAFLPKAGLTTTFKRSLTIGLK
jgi:hypothetical protein